MNPEEFLKIVTREWTETYLLDGLYDNPTLKEVTAAMGDMFPIGVTPEGSLMDAQLTCGWILAKRSSNEKSKVPEE